MCADRFNIQNFYCLLWERIYVFCIDPSRQSYLFFCYAPLSDWFIWKWLNMLIDWTIRIFNPLKTKRSLLYLKTQFVPRSKHFSSRL